MSRFIILFSLILQVSFVSAAPTSALQADEDLKAIPVNNEIFKKAVKANAQAHINKLLEVFPGTKSNKYHWLESTSDKRSEFLMRTQKEAKEKLMGSAQIEKIHAFLTPKSSETETEQSSLELTETRRLKVFALNFIRKVYDVEGEQKTLLMTTEDFPGKQAYIHGLYPSPDKKFVGVLFSLNGSIDNALAKIYDVNQKTFISDIEMFSGDFSMHWFSNTQVIYIHPQSSSKGESTVIENVVTGEQLFKVNHGIGLLEDWVGYTDYSTDDTLVQDRKNGTVLVYKNLKTTSFDAQNKTHFFLTANYVADMAGGIYSLEKLNNAEIKTFAAPIPNKNLNAIQILERADGYANVLVADYSYDADTTVIIYKLDGSIERQVTLPASLNFDGLSFNKETLAYQIEVTNINGRSTTLKWPITELELKIEEEAFKPKEGAEYEVVSRIEYFKSADGELIPARITHKKDLLMNGSIPVFMDAYGGFMLQGYLAPVTNKMRLEFIKRGGIIVGTGIRGGSERGRAWYAAGAGKNKINTTLDLIAIARGMVERGYTQPQKIAVTGTSNGGYVVASAGRYAPDAFGLVIPVNGVQDQLDFSSLDRWGIGWENDFLNPYDAKNYAFNYVRSPLEIKFNKDVAEFLIINGEFDTRVNKVHSYKLKALYDDYAPGKSILFSVDKAGHWPTSTYLIDDVGIRANSILWAKIYDFMGMEF